MDAFHWCGRPLSVVLGSSALLVVYPWSFSTPGLHPPPVARPPVNVLIWVLLAVALRATESPVVSGPLPGTVVFGTHVAGTVTSGIVVAREAVSVTVVSNIVVCGTFIPLQYCASH